MAFIDVYNWMVNRNFRFGVDYRIVGPNLIATQNVHEPVQGAPCYISQEAYASGYPTFVVGTPAVGTFVGQMIIENKTYWTIALNLLNL